MFETFFGVLCVLLLEIAAGSIGTCLSLVRVLAGIQVRDLEFMLRAVA